MLLVTVAEESAEQVVLRVEGWLCGANVALLEQEGTAWLDSGRCLVLDLRGVQFIDDSGARLLRRWFVQGAIARGSSAFVQLMLDTTQGDES